MELDYLGHQFKICGKTLFVTRFECKVCMVIVYQLYSESIYVSTKTLQVLEELNLNCNEIIIKQIIE